MLTPENIEHLEISKVNDKPRIIARIEGREGLFVFHFARHTLDGMKDKPDLLKRVVVARQNARDKIAEEELKALEAHAMTLTQDERNKVATKSIDAAFKSLAEEGFTFSEQGFSFPTK